VEGGDAGPARAAEFRDFNLGAGKELVVAGPAGGREDSDSDGEEVTFHDIEDDDAMVDNSKKRSNVEGMIKMKEGEGEIFHNRRSKGSRGKISCEVCGDEYSRAHYYYHLKVKHKRTKSKCSKCNQSVYSLKFHTCKNVGKKEKTCCPICSAMVVDVATHQQQSKGCQGKKRVAGGGEGEGSGRQQAKTGMTGKGRKKVPVEPAPVCEYERIRARNIAERQALFRSLALEEDVREVKRKT
jgi:hypothetical protein